MPETLTSHYIPTSKVQRRKNFFYSPRKFQSTIEFPQRQNEINRCLAKSKKASFHSFHSTTPVKIEFRCEFLAEFLSWFSFEKETINCQNKLLCYRFYRKLLPNRRFSIRPLPHHVRDMNEREKKNREGKGCWVEFLGSCISSKDNGWNKWRLKQWWWSIQVAHLRVEGGFEVVGKLAQNRFVRGGSN